MLRFLVFEGGTTQSVSDLATAREALGREGAVVWADIEGRSEDSDELLRDIFGFHPLAIEDVYKDRHRPKVEDYDDYLYLIVRSITLAESLGSLETEELDLFLGSNFVVTHHSQPLRAVQASRAALEAKGETRGAAFVAHAILDRVVDELRPLADRYMRAIDLLEDEVLAGEDRLAQILELKGALHRVRRLATAQRNVMSGLAQGAYDEVPKAARPFFRDVHEHLVQLTDSLEAERDELNAVFDAFHSLSAHRMNEIMKVLTLISTIMLPLTFLAGVYGMNFDHMPELHWDYAYPSLWVVMIVLTVGMTLYFRRRGWL